MVPSDLERDPFAPPSYTAEEQERLTQNLHSVTERVHLGEYSARPLSISVVEELHRQLFDAVRDHAGRHRNRGFGSEHLQFGPNRSSHRDSVKSELDLVLHKGERMVRAVADAPDAPNYEVAAIEVAACIHADVIRVHPFQDGNGRTTRLLMGVILVRLNMRPIVVEACKQEYFDALNRYFTGDSVVLVDLLIRLAEEQLPTG